MRMIECILKRLRPVCVVLAIVGNFQAAALVQSQFAGYGSAQDPLVFGGSGFPASLSFQKFDPSIGTLDAVTITLSSTDTVQATVINLGSDTTFQNAQATATLTILDLAGLDLNTTLATDPFSGSLAAGTLSSPTSAYGSLQQGENSSTLSVLQQSLSLYEWSGVGQNSFNLSLSAIESSSGAGSGDVFFSGTANSYGSVEVDYIYSVPEPNCLSLAILSFCGVVVGRRRRSRCSQR